MGEDPSAIRQEIEETRARMGDTVEAIGYKADVKARAKESVMDKVEGVRGGVRERITGAKETVGEATPSTEDVKGTAKHAVGVAQSNPLGLMIGGMAAGFLAGMLLPSTSIEEEKLAPKASQLKDRAMDTASDAVERGRQVAEQVTTNVAETAKETAKETIQEGMRGSGGSRQ